MFDQTRRLQLLVYFLASYINVGAKVILI